MAYGQILQLHEIEQLAYEIAHGRQELDSNEQYHRSIIPWAKSRGGMALGAHAAWQRGWARGFKVS